MSGRAESYEPVADAIVPNVMGPRAPTPLAMPLTRPVAVQVSLDRHVPCSIVNTLGPITERKKNTMARTITTSIFP